MDIYKSDLMFEKINEHNIFNQEEFQYQIDIIFSGGGSSYYLNVHLKHLIKSVERCIH